MATIATIVGARPQFVKAAAVSRAIAQQATLRETLIHTGQHYDDRMSAVFFSELGIPKPDFQLGVGSGSHGVQTGHMLAALERVLLDTRPDLVLVYGDTNSTLAGALAACKLHLPVAHVEAGLRSFNRRMPEEINRVLTDHAADILLAPTELAVSNLLREGIDRRRIHAVGDVMYDVALHYRSAALERPSRLAELGVSPRNYVLATVHGAENTDDPARLQAIVDALTALAQLCPVVMPLHPRTRGALDRLGLLNRAQQALRLIEPVGYLDMLALECHARLIATDSGGVQKEAFFCGVPCVTLRDETEWQELLDLGANRLAPPVSSAALLSVLHDALANPSPVPQADQLYGGGHAAPRIVERLREFLATA